MSGKEQIKNANIPQMNINRLVDELTTAYCNIINANVPIRKFPSVMLWGAPGEQYDKLYNIRTERRKVKNSLLLVQRILQRIKTKPLPPTTEMKYNFD